jgi:hypothetical protein
MGTCRSDRINKANFKFLSDILIKLEMKFNAVLETPLVMETWNDE